MMDDRRISGFIDLTHAGIADPYRDLSLCYMSLIRNTDGTYGTVYPDLDPDRLFAYLDAPVDREKLRYYILLDAFF